MPYRSHFILPLPDQVSPDVRAYFHALHQRLDSEFKAISKSQSTSSTVIQTLVSGGGGGNTPTTKPAFVVTQTVSAAGSVTVNFPNTGDRKSTRLNSITRGYLVCRLLLE